MSVLRVAGLVAARDLRQLLTYRLAFVMTVAATLWTILPAWFLDQLIPPSELEGEASSYFEFLVTGLLLGFILEACMDAPANGARHEQTNGTLEILASEPVPATSLGLGWAAYPTVQGLLNVLVVAAIAPLLGYEVTDPHWGFAVIGTVGTMLASLGMGLGFAGVVIAIQQGDQLPDLAAAGLAFISGVLFPVSLLPGPLQWLARLSPVTHGLNLLRYGVAGQTGDPPWGDVVALGVLAVLALAIGTAVFRAGFWYARRHGSLQTF